MGMFDELTVNLQLPGMPTAPMVFQTKDFDCTLEKYTLHVTGRLTRGKDEVPMEDFDGDVDFYTDLDQPTTWIEYRASFTCGVLSRVSRKVGKDQYMQLTLRALLLPRSDSVMEVIDKNEPKREVEVDVGALEQQLVAIYSKPRQRSAGEMRIKKLRLLELGAAFGSQKATDLFKEEARAIAADLDAIAELRELLPVYEELADGLESERMTNTANHIQRIIDIVKRKK